MDNIVYITVAVDCANVPEIIKCIQGLISSQFLLVYGPFVLNMSIHVHIKASLATITGLEAPFVGPIVLYIPIATLLVVSQICVVAVEGLERSLKVGLSVAISTKGCEDPREVCGTIYKQEFLYQLAQISLQFGLEFSKATKYFVHLLLCLRNHTVETIGFVLKCGYLLMAWAVYWYSCCNTFSRICSGKTGCEVA